MNCCGAQRVVLGIFSTGVAIFPRCFPAGGVACERAGLRFAAGLAADFNAGFDLVVIAFFQKISKSRLAATQ